MYKQSNLKSNLVTIFCAVPFSLRPVDPALHTTQRLVPPEWCSLQENGLINSQQIHAEGNLTVSAIRPHKALNLPST